MTVIEQLENDQFHEDEGDAVERAYRIGWNAAVRLVHGCLLAGIGLDSQFVRFSLMFVGEHEGDEIERAYRRGRNAGVRHVRDVLRKDQERRERAECEAADERHKQDPVGFGLAELVENTPADGGE